LGRRKIITSLELEKRADEVTENWATKFSEAIRDNEDSGEETYRTCFRRDRDRILYSKGFRRLQYKTQVFNNEANDHSRTRLTHTLEVQQLATSIADALGCNRDLAEAIAVGHDLGHTPFGHAVESILDEKLRMLGEGGFSHAVQSIRYVEHIESRNEHEGMNLCKQVREGIIRHDSDLLVQDGYKNYIEQWDCSGLRPSEPGSIESQIVYWADKIAYLSHDWDDFVNSGLKDEAIKNGIIIQEQINEVWGPLMGDDYVGSKDIKLRDLIRNINTRLIQDSFKTLVELDISSSSEVRDKVKERQENYRRKCYNEGIEIDNKKLFRDTLLINFSEDYRELFFKARKFINEYYICSPTIMIMDEKAKYMAEKVFDKFVNNHKLLPWKTKKTIDDKKGRCSPVRIIADHIACMTDRYISKVYEELFLPRRWPL
jgi:dGTPase